MKDEEGPLCSDTLPGPTHPVPSSHPLPACGHAIRASFSMSLLDDHDQMLAGGIAHQESDMIWGLV